MTSVGLIAAGVVVVVVSFIIAFAVLPSLTSSVETFKSDANSSTTLDALADLVPIIVLAGAVLVGLGFLFAGIRGLNTG